jgi:hypothetical protein
MSAQRSAIYNELRRDHCKRAGWGFMFAAFLVGSTLAAPGVPQAVGVVAFFLLLVGVRFLRNGSEHGDVSREFRKLVASTHGDPAPSAGDVTARCERLWGDEPPAYHALNALAYNAVQASNGRDPSGNLVIPPFRVATAQWLPWSPGLAVPANRAKES